MFVIIPADEFSTACDHVFKRNKIYQRSRYDFQPYRIVRCRWWVSSMIVFDEIPKNIEEMKEWCSDSCQGRYMYLDGKHVHGYLTGFAFKSPIFLEFEDDALLFKLRWL